ncbi:GNAT family N-acetyltransferase [Jeongeupia naejangsanensis]|uniref:N-acetyltransferase n=1 Tax=Jeongeupia naejangsanensis TaxID=613195 RepID=A0ABS2BLB4_9NEIS|nr:GNAT family N-acetyltransferase [Jeongeupia naejangsanensis]MBM3115868.1 N-acetyltransferase [Jeongeupia naejangsanensis]
MDIQLHSRIAALDPARWNTLAGSQTVLQHAFLDALERSGCVSAQTGWQPCHLSVDGLAAAVPLYLKSHSFGEYVFDWSWVRAYEQHGLDYYPKLVSAVPFTPVPGSRLMTSDDGQRLQLAHGLRAAAESLDAGSVHVLFHDDADATALEAAGFFLRSQIQFHWQRQPDWRDFDDFLDALKRDKRKKLRQERRKVLDAGIEIVRKRGAAITEADWRFFTACYTNTYDEHRSNPYLTLDFFLRLWQSLPDACLLILAYRNGHPVAAALDLVDSDRLYGRYWGAQWDDAGFIPALHFELCYYQGIEFALEHGLPVFEGGAQGEHKLARGFAPVLTQSAHWLRHPGFHQAVARAVHLEARQIRADLDALSAGYTTPAD